MKAYPPAFATPEESVRKAEQSVTTEVVSDETLTEYFTVLMRYYRSTLESYFGPLASHIPFYASYPYTISIVRMGNGVIVGHKPSSSSAIRIMRLEDFKPPLEQINLFDIMKRLESPFGSFDFTAHAYSAQEAEILGIRNALNDALDYFWHTVDAVAFSTLCTELLKAEGIKSIAKEIANQSAQFDVIGEVVLNEPAGYRRVECWAFEYKHHRDDRVSVEELLDREALLASIQDEVDVMCLVTSGDLTSIANFMSVDNPRIRVWDRSVLNLLVNHHIEVLQPYFRSYAEAAAMLAGPQTSANQASSRPTGPTRVDEFSTRLEACPSGLKHFSEYERIGTEIWSYIFEGKLGVPKSQRTTGDKTQRRDVLYPNLGAGRFFQRIATRFGADFLIVDFKNYASPVGPKAVEEASKYANNVIGKFVVVVSRKGANSSIQPDQLRIYRDRQTMVIVVSDQQLLEMVARKENGEDPEDVLEDLQQELAIKY